MFETTNKILPCTFHTWSVCMWPELQQLHPAPPRTAPPISGPWPGNLRYPAPPKRPVIQKIVDQHTQYIYIYYIITVYIYIYNINIYTYVFYVFQVMDDKPKFFWAFLKEQNVAQYTWTREPTFHLLIIKHGVPEKQSSSSMILTCISLRGLANHIWFRVSNLNISDPTKLYPAKPFANLQATLKEKTEACV